MTELHDPIHAQSIAPLTWARVCRLDDLEPCWGEAVLVTGEQVAVFRVDDSKVYAVQQADPVTGAHVMARGITGSRCVDGEVRRTIASPLHKQVYDLATGICLSEPGHRLLAYPTRIVDGWLEIAA